VQNEFKGKTILVTGGTGSIGSEIVRQLLKFKPKKIRVFARHEDRHYTLMNELVADDESLRFVIGDIRDRDRLRMAMEGVDVVFHAAALKQVAMSEYNPFEAVKTNILGSKNVINAAINQQVERVVLISTDKACQPVNLYGSTKLCAEKLFINGNLYSFFIFRSDGFTKLFKNSRIRDNIISTNFYGLYFPIFYPLKNRFTANS